MLVCKLWKDIVSDMDDKIMLVGGPDGYEPDWPPKKKRHEAKYIRYLDGRPEQYVSFQFPWSGAPFRTASVRGPKTFKINSEKPLAPVTLIERMNITVSDPVDGPLTTFTRNVRALHLQMSTNRYIDIFRVDILDNLTYLGLCDSGHGQSFKSFVQQVWAFPALRALVLQASDIHLPENAMEKWRCPNLTMFKYMFRRVYLGPGPLCFINGHAQKLNELEIHGNGTAHWHVAENWRRLMALKSYAFDSLESLLKALPFMQYLWYPTPGEILPLPRRRLRVRLSVGLRDPLPKELLQQGAQYRQLLANMDIFLSTTWLQLSGETYRQVKPEYANFFAAVEELELDISDGRNQPFSSPDAQRLHGQLAKAEANAKAKEY
ncbi:SubName: Full=Uncharacterized protein {ECO:0000313/EMBL:CCA76985.1} [Serendipita indica DSM 11827]|nr:SubName: Full=Uncharacterized protein {ECO:0000313/EMBL:CCA76985.1} [Serendipita indica DSM 11827]